MKRYFLMVAVAVCMALAANAQQRLRLSRAHTVDTVPQLVRSYADSLQAVRSRIDSVAQAANGAEDSGTDSKYYRLFVPMTFYHNVAGHAFALDSAANDVDETLMDVYMRRPDLVRSTQSQLDRVGPVMDVSHNTVRPKVDIVEKVQPKLKDEDVYAPVNIYVEKPNFWNFSGNYSLQLFQNYVSSNWYKGGESNYSMLATVTLQANYNNKQRFRWDNKLEMRLGFQNSRGDTLHAMRASEDLIRYTGKLGIQASKNWYYTFQVIARTQFMRGLKSNDPMVYSRFLAPLYVTPSLGMDYKVNWAKGRFQGTVHMAPIAYNFTYTRERALATRFGIDEGRHAKHDFGSELTADLKWQIAKPVSWKTRLYAYTTYKRMQMEWENTFTFVVNRYISSNIFVYPRFDDGVARDKDYGYWQLKEYISLGFNFDF